MADKPACKRCDKHHWPFVACEQADEKLAEEESRERNRQAAFPLRSVPEGFTPWGGDRLDTIERSGTTYWQSK